MTSDSRRRRRLVRKARTPFIALIGAFAILAVVAGTALAVLPGSPSKFESGNDPTLGLGNMLVDTTGNTDWVSVTGNAAYFHGTDVAAKNNDNSFTPGQKQDTTCPSIEGHKNPPKDDFTDVASFSEKASGGAHDGETYLYGATLRFTANGNASENIELKQSSVLCPGQPAGGLTVRSAGDKLIAIDYLGGGSAVQFHVLTWVTSGACFVANDPNPCWGANVVELDPASAEGGVNPTDLNASQNPINGKAIVAGQFAEFGVNLALAGIIPAGSCKSFNQTVWESRSSGSSFVSSTKDISVENKSINQCAGVTVTKAGSDGGAQTGAVFTLYAGTIASGNGTVVGTCTVIADGTCPVTTGSFSNLNPGTYHIDETTVPAGYDKDPTLPLEFTLAAGESKVLSFTDPAQAGALAIVKNSTKGGAVLQAGAVFSYGAGLSVTDNGAGDSDSAVGSVCVSGLAPGPYSVTETSPPPGYGADTGGAQSVTVVNGTNCTSNLPGAGATATFSNPPLSDIQVNFRDGGSTETSAVIACDNATGTSDTTAASGWDTSDTVTGVEAPTTITCTITIDP
jgi:Prealbumin-like fold domain